jgi:hypothetical protein
MKSLIAGLVVLAAPMPTLAQESGIDRCLTLSFAPIDVNLPACTALIDNPRGLGPARLAEIHAARAEAYRFAITYHGEHDVQPKELLAAALADLDKAAALAPAGDLRVRVLYDRGALREQLADPTGAIEDYRSVLTAYPAHQDARRGLERLGAEP